jgi:hypothetical protein
VTAILWINALGDGFGGEADAVYGRLGLTR